jgi:hypothetical protein
MAMNDNGVVVELRAINKKRGKICKFIDKE